MKRRDVCLMASAIAATAGMALATPLPSGGVHHHPAATSPPDYTNTAHPGIGVAIDSMVSSLMQGSSWATLTSEVYLGASGLVFVYTLDNDGSPPQRLTSMTIAGPWSNHIVDAGADGSMTGNPAQAAPLSLGNQNTHVNATWSIGGELQFGHVSQFWFATNVNDYGVRDATVFDGPAGSAQGFAFSVIPLPSAGLMGLAGIGLIAVRRRNR